MTMESRDRCSDIDLPSLYCSHCNRTLKVATYKKFHLIYWTRSAYRQRWTVDGKQNASRTVRAYGVDMDDDYGGQLGILSQAPEVVEEHEDSPMQSRHRAAPKNLKR